MDWDDTNYKRRGGGGFEGRPQFNLPKINLPGFRRSNLSAIILAIVVLWIASGIYIVQPDEKGVVLRFGEWVKSAAPGPHWHLPFPIEMVEKPRVTEVKRVEVGFRTIDPGPPARYMDRPAESLMLTGDLNIIDIDIIVQYFIADAAKYLFNVRDIRETVADASEAAIREVMGKKKIDEALTYGKAEIQEETKKRLQEILDLYDSGLVVQAVQLQDVHPPKEVIDAFKDVASALEDKDRLINEAQGYRNAVIPETRGGVAKILAEAEAYKREKEKRAMGDVGRFNAILAEYQKAEEVTRKRLYIETMEEVMSGIDKVIMDRDMGAGPIPLLNIGRPISEVPKDEK